MFAGHDKCEEKLHVCGNFSSAVKVTEIVKFASPKDGFTCRANMSHLHFDLIIFARKSNRVTCVTITGKAKMVNIAFIPYLR